VNTSRNGESAAPEPVAWWRFDGGAHGPAWDSAARIEDPIEGNHRLLAGVSGRALRLDGFTTVITRPAARAPRLAGRFTIEAWIALAAYPWDECPLVDRSRNREAGYRFAVGPRGEVSLQLSLCGEWKTCASGDGAVPLRRWVHLAGSFDADDGLTVYVNGAQVGRLAARGEPAHAEDADLRIGMNDGPRKPSHIHRDHGTLGSWFSLDGILDELKIHDRVLTADEIAASCQANAPAAAPDLPPRVMPSGPPGPGRFGAYYCRLEYCHEWDALWPVGPDADVLVRFDASAARVVFWRGTRYSPAWVSENGLWMADQSVEAWNDQEGCFEHMQDRHCRYSHVRIIESTDARVVVHWRYAPVSAHNHLWRVDEKTGWACWIDEYYCLYPDVMGVRKVIWKTGTLGDPRQFQESIPFCHPGQLQGDVVEADYATVANLNGQTGVLSFVADPGNEKPVLPGDLTIQMHNLKSANRPFILFEPGNDMRYTVHKGLAALSGPGSCCHWPVGQAICDGRTSQAADRPTSFLGFPISYPPLHEADGRSWWNGLYGMTDGPIDRLVIVARSWANAPELRVEGGGFTSGGYDLGQRAYRLRRDAAAGRPDLEAVLLGSNESPIHNPAIVIADWGQSGASLAIDGRNVPRGPDFRIGHRHRVDGSDLVAWIRLEAARQVRLSLRPGPPEKEQTE